jgi:hypothetical protein
MKSTLLSATSSALGLVLSLGVTNSFAIRIDPAPAFTNTPECDNPRLTATHELGVQPTFPVDERIRVSVSTSTLVVCSRPPFAGMARPDDGIANSWQVAITNLSPNEYTDLWFVADGNNLIGNRDGTVNGSDAFRIDTDGNNRPLRSQSRIGPNFEPNDTWTFIVQDYNWSVGALMPTFGSNGIAGNSVGAADGSTASIIARLVPEPSTLSLLIGSLVNLIIIAYCQRRREFRMSG